VAQVASYRLFISKRKRNIILKGTILIWNNNRSPQTKQKLGQYESPNSKSGAISDGLEG